MHQLFYIYIYTHTDIYTHTHTCVCVCVCVCILSLLSFPPTSPHPIPLDLHGAPSWISCAIRQLSTSYLFYTWWYIYDSTTLSVNSILFSGCIRGFTFTSPRSMGHHQLLTTAHQIHCFEFIWPTQAMHYWIQIYLRATESLHASFYFTYSNSACWQT